MQYIQEAQWTLSRKTQRPTNKYIIIKMLKVKDKEKILKSARDKFILKFRHKTATGANDLE